MTYGYPERRKTKKDKKMKRRVRVYKKGGKFRSMNISVESEEETKDKKNKDKK